MKIWRCEVTETRAYSVVYFVRARTRDEAADKCRTGWTMAEESCRLEEVTGRFLNAQPTDVTADEDAI